jgi:hypothetical protein
MLTINLKDLDDDDPEALLYKLQALRKAGLRVSLQIKGDREQASQLFTQLSVWYGMNTAAQRRLLWSFVPASLGSLLAIWLGILLWV